MSAENSAQSVTRLVNRARAGDRSAFNELVVRYRGRILALALHLTGQESEAEDITQEVFFKAFQKLPSFEGRSHFFTWVYRMTVNRSLNARRDLQRRREETYDDPRVLRALRVDAPNDPRRATELRSTYIQLLRALDSLPKTMRASVVLVVLHGLTHAETAAIQDCSPGTVAWHIHQARRRLQTEMGTSTKRGRACGGLSRELTRLLPDWVLPSPQFG